MLDRPASSAARSRRRRRAYRLRQARGVIAVTVELDGDVIDWLERLRWLAPGDAGRSGELSPG
jgi:hypothetical protein